MQRRIALVVRRTGPLAAAQCAVRFQSNDKGEEGTGAAGGDLPAPSPAQSPSSVPHSASKTRSSPWNARHRTSEEKAVDRRQGSERLTSLFRDDATRVSLYQRPGFAVPVGEHGGRVASIRSPAETSDVDEGWATSLQQQQQQQTLKKPSGARRGFEYDEDTGDTLVDPESSAARELTAIETLEQELLDDDFFYFPPVRQKPDDAIGVARETESAAPRYVPGQQIVPPGMTRYRVDVQYQGSDFDGWFKNTAKQLYRQVVQADGSVKRVPLDDNHANAGAGSSSAASYEGMSTRYHARSVLEEALAVALDVPAVTVVSAVIPETGVSVRRLACHVDVPSEVEMQPRTILQRATLWLQQRRQPLAILSCHPCRNQDFHARHSGVRRVYCYRILNRVAPPLFDAGLQWHVDRQLDVARMQRFAQAMQGTKDYGYFADPKMANALRRAARSTPGLSSGAYIAEHAQPTIDHRERRGGMKGEGAPKEFLEKGLTNLQRAAALPTFNEYGQRVVSFSAKPREYHKARTNLPTVRTIDSVSVVRQDDEVLLWFVGPSFLRHQIRNMVSVLKASGHGLWDEMELQHAFNSGFEVSRKKFLRERLPPAPVHGLTLWDVEYPAQHGDDFVPFVDSGPYEEMDVSSIH